MGGVSAGRAPDAIEPSQRQQRLCHRAMHPSAAHETGKQVGVNHIETHQVTRWRPSVAPPTPVWAAARAAQSHARLACPSNAKGHASGAARWRARRLVHRIRLSGAHSRPNHSRWASQRIGVKAQQHQCGSTSVPSMIAPIVAPVDIRYDTRRRDVGAAEPVARSDQGLI